MLKSGGNTLCFLITLSVVLLIFSTCKSVNYSGEDLPPREISIDVTERTEEFKNHLFENGIDTVLIISKKCPKCISTPFLGNKKKMLDGVEYSILQYSLPAYIFWKDEGKYFVKRIDQFAEYEPLERWVHLQYPLYDYFFKNVDDIRNERYVSGYLDTTLVRIKDYSSEKDTIIKEIYIDYYHQPNKVVPIERPFSTETKIEFYYADSSFVKSLPDKYFTPVAMDRFETEIQVNRQRKNLNDSVIVGNSKANYHLNRSMKIFIWKQMIESELFEIEMRQLWKPLSSK